MIALTHKRATVNGVTLHYVTVGKGPVVLCMHRWPQNHREFLPVIEGFADQYTFKPLQAETSGVPLWTLEDK